MTPDEKRNAMAIAISKASDALTLLHDALALVRHAEGGPPPRSACVAMEDALRSTHVALAKAEIVQRRMP